MANKGEKIKVRVITTDSAFEDQAVIPESQRLNAKKSQEFIEQSFQKNENHQDFTKKKPKKFKKFLIFFIIFLLIIALTTLAGFFVFSGVKKGTSRVDLKIQAPPAVASGETIEYLLEITNRDQVTIKKVDLLFNYPYGFEFSEADLVPNNETKNFFTLPDIQAGDKYLLKVKGRLVGEIEETKILEATVNYQPENFNSNFQVKKTAISIIKSSIIGLNIETPETIIGNQEFLLKIKYQNNQIAELKNLRLELEPPEDLQIIQEGSTPWQGEWYWDNDSLAVNQETEVTVKCYFANSHPLNNKFTAKISFKENDVYKIITYKRVNLNVINPELELKLLLNDQAELTNVNWGEQLTYKINLKNNSNSFTIPEGQLQLKLNSGLFDQQSLIDDYGGVWTEAGLSWGEDTKLYQEFLQELKPGQEINFEIKLKIIEQPSDLENYNPTQLTNEAVLELSSQNFGENFSVLSNKIITTVGQQVLFTAKAFYFLNNEIQVGSGPVPPQVNETTNYKIYWYLDPANNNLTDIEVRAILPPAMSWPDNYQITSGNFSFDPASRQLTWELSDLAVGDNAQAFFFVSLTPQAADLGQVITLLNPSTVTYKINNSQKSQTSDSLDTNLKDDPVKSGQGIVIN